MYGVRNDVCNGVTRGVRSHVRCWVQNQNQNQTVSYVFLSSSNASATHLQTATCARANACRSAESTC